MPLTELYLSEKLGRNIKTGSFNMIEPDMLLLCDALGHNVLNK